MATLTNKADLSVKRSARAAGHVPESSLRFDYAVCVLSAVFVFGLLLDSWAHVHVASSLETFFTPWHAVMYGGFTLVMLVHAVSFYRNINRGSAFMMAMPPGYMLSMLGLMVFTLGGVGDMFWHTIFGIEVDLEATLSPSHLLLMVGALVFLSGPFRAAWTRTGAAHHTWKAMLPALASMALASVVLLVLTQYFNLYVDPRLVIGRFEVARYTEDLGAIGGVIVPTLVVMIPVLLTLRRWPSLPFGAMTLMIAVPNVLMGISRWRYMEDFPGVFAAVLAGGLLADVLVRVLRPMAARRTMFRLASFLIPCVQVGVLLLAIEVMNGMRWSPHMGLGAPVLAGLVGLGMSLLALPPQIPAEADATA